MKESSGNYIGRNTEKKTTALLGKNLLSKKSIRTLGAPIIFSLIV